jgi:hypothetical protein
MPSSAQSGHVVKTDNPTARYLPTGASHATCPLSLCRLPNIANGREIFGLIDFHRPHRDRPNGTHFSSALESLDFRTR